MYSNRHTGKVFFVHYLSLKSMVNWMDDFWIERAPEKLSSISRTIRLDAALFERIMEESEKTGVSFNKIVNQCITYAFQHYREPKVTPDGR